jgi:hypothetical protein
VQANPPANDLIFPFNQRYLMWAWHAGPPLYLPAVENDDTLIGLGNRG